MSERTGVQYPGVVDRILSDGQRIIALDSVHQQVVRARIERRGLLTVGQPARGLKVPDGGRYVKEWQNRRKY